MKKFLGGLATLVLAVIAVLTLGEVRPGSGGAELPYVAVETLEAPAPAPDESDQPDRPEQESGSGEYRALLSDLEVKGRAPMTGYDRDLFGQAWSDDVTVPGGHNGCDTRNDVLRRDVAEAQIREGTFGCLVESGTLTDPYSGEVIDFERGDNQVHIDHVVPLADAWAKGAQQLDDETRRNFANDPANLLAVGARVNQQKSAGDAATWQPPQRGFRCDYARMQIEVKHSYGLWVTAAERDALERELGRCDDQH